MTQILYKSTKLGATQQWSVSTEGATFTCTFGQLGGKLQSQTTTCTPKNTGRANETTPEQQAILEAEALVTKKLKSGYSTSLTCDSEVKLPMKVKAYQDQLNNVKFPCVSTPKLDGVNAIVRRTGQTLTWYSRGGEVYPSVKHLHEQVFEAMAALRSEELNCELYIHGKYLQEIQSAVKKPNELSKDLTAGIFDIADSEHVYSQRRAFMANWKSSQLNPTVFAIIGTMCYSHEDIEICYNKAIAEGYEGTVIKNLDGLYQHNIRSSDQFKYKKAQSAEFMIVGFDLDKRNHPVFNLRSKASTVFSAKPKGTHEFLSSIDPETYVGKYATVEYETLSMAGTPLKPIFVSLRECNSLGEPTE